MENIDGLGPVVIGFECLSLLEGSFEIGRAHV